MDEKHSPNSFYEKLKEEISGNCCKCGESFTPSEMETHFKADHDSTKMNKTEAGQIPSVLSTIGEDSGEFELVEPNVKIE